MVSLKRRFLVMAQGDGPGGGGGGGTAVSGSNGIDGKKLKIYMEKTTIKLVKNGR
jgi:hypothetical protein